MKTKKQTGRISVLTPALTKNIATRMRAINSLEDAAVHCGVHRSTVFTWLAKGREQKVGPYRDFLDAIERAKAARRIGFAAQLLSHGKKNWQAIAWLAERTDPQHFGLRIKVHVSEEVERMQDKLQRHLSPEEYERALEALSQPDDSDEAPGGSEALQAALGGGDIQE